MLFNAVPHAKAGQCAFLGKERATSIRVLDAKVDVKGKA